MQGKYAVFTRCLDGFRLLFWHRESESSGRPLHSKLPCSSSKWRIGGSQVVSFVAGPVFLLCRSLRQRGFALPSSPDQTLSLCFVCFFKNQGCFDQRMRAWQRWQEAQNTLQKKREAEAKLLWANKPDKLQQAKEEIAEVSSSATVRKVTVVRRGNRRRVPPPALHINIEINSWWCNCRGLFVFCSQTTSADEQWWRSAGIMFNNWLFCSCGIIHHTYHSSEPLQSSQITARSSELVLSSFTVRWNYLQLRYHRLALGNINTYEIDKLTVLID